MIHCIFGHSASGKTTVQKILKEKIPAITTYTTRPIRHNEKEGIHYHFISNKEFEQKLKEGFFIEHNLIEANYWYYGMSLSDINYKEQDFCVVLDPRRYDILLSKIDKKYLRSYFINLSEHERLIRMARRRDKIEEIFRRILSDRKDYENFDKIADVVLYSKNSKNNANIILDFIKGESVEKS